jgi:hypothetical protein
MRAILLSACLLGLPLVKTPTVDSDCTGIGTTVAITLICSGTCSEGNCESHSDGMDGRGAFSYCGCASKDYDTCCTVVIRDGQARKRGTCPPCGASGRCHLENNPDGELFEPVCGSSGKVLRSKTNLR